MRIREQQRRGAFAGHILLSGSGFETDVEMSIYVMLSVHIYHYYIIILFIIHLRGHILY